MGSFTRKSGAAACMVLTSDLFEAYLGCPMKCSLRALGEAGGGNAYADWIGAQTAAYRHEQARRLRKMVANTECIGDALGARDLRSPKWNGLSVDCRCRASMRQA
jgi:hypothetical protein